MGEAENELRDVPRRIARERVPTIAVRRDSHVFPYVDAHGRPPEVIFCGLGSEMRISLDQNRVDEPAHRFGLVVN